MGLVTFSPGKYGAVDLPPCLHGDEHCGKLEQADDGGYEAEAPDQILLLSCGHEETEGSVEKSYNADT